MKIGGWWCTYMDALTVSHSPTAAGVNMLHWQMRWDKPWEDGGRGVCPDSCQHLTHATQKLDGCSYTSHARTFESCTGDGPPSCTPYFHNISINRRSSLSRSIRLLSILLSTRCLIVFPACCIIFHTGTWTASCRRQQNIRLHKHALAIWRLREATRCVKLIFMQGVHQRCW